MAASSDNCICVIQARRGSRRLPDKVLMPLGGVPVLQRVIAQCQAIPGVDRVVCAVPESTENDALEALARDCGADVVRGSEPDVLSRYIKALDTFPARYIMRVTADCPLLDPALCQTLLDAVIERGLDYAVTAWWPHGLDCEVMTDTVLRRADKEATHPNDREHVTLWIKRQDSVSRWVYMADHDYSAAQRWVLDYPEDFDFLGNLIRALPQDVSAMSWRGILEVIEGDPSLNAVNRHRIDDWRAQTSEIYKAVND